MKHVALYALALAASTASAGPIAAAEPADWVEARSRHFAVVSNTGEQQARATALQFEHVRTMLGQAIGEARFDPREPVVVLAVDDEGGLREVLPQYWDRKGQRPVAGYWSGPYRHYIALRVDAPERERYRRALHEYVHVLTHANVADLPPWLDEGLSELWGTAVVHDDSLEIGRPAPPHLKVLRARHSWIPLDELLAMERAPDAGDKRKLSMFYAQSWALTHYLLLGGSATALELAPSDYVERLRKGATPAEAAALAFGDLPPLEQRLREYVQAGRFRAVRIDGASQPPTLRGSAYNGNLEGGGEARVRRLSTAESLAVRAGFLVDGERPAAALPLLAEALRLDGAETSVLETLGRFHFQQNNPIEAAGWFDRAIESGSASYLAYFYRAILTGPVPGRVPVGDRSNGCAGRGEGEEVVRAEDHLQRAIGLNPGFAPAYVRLADLYAQHASRLEEALPLMRRATELEPDDAAYWVDLGRLLLRLHRLEEARATGQQGLAVVRAASSRELVEEFLREIERGQVGR